MVVEVVVVVAEVVTVFAVQVEVVARWGWWSRSWRWSWSRSWSVEGNKKRKNRVTYLHRACIALVVSRVPACL